jgi:hypothetical protein
MKGPTKKPKRIKLGWLERFITFAGLLVFLGVWMESGRELSWAIVNRTWPSQEAVGGALVVIGVFAEVAIGLFIAYESKRAELKANEEISQANDRAAQAEQAAAEANLARVQMEGRLVRLTINRHLTDEEIEALQERLKPFAGQPFVVTFAPTDDAATIEPLFFSSQLREVLERAGWVWAGDNIPLTERVGRGVLIECNAGHQRAAFGLQKALSDVGIAAKASWIEHVKLPQLTIHVGLV